MPADALRHLLKHLAVFQKRCRINTDQQRVQSDFPDNLKIITLIVWILQTSTCLTIFLKQFTAIFHEQIGHEVMFGYFQLRSK